MFFSPILLTNLIIDIFGGSTKCKMLTQSKQSARELLHIEHNSLTVYSFDGGILFYFQIICRGKYDFLMSLFFFKATFCSLTSISYDFVHFVGK